VVACVPAGTIPGRVAELPDFCGYSRRKGTETNGSMAALVQGTNAGSSETAEWMPKDDIPVEDVSATRQALL